MYLNSITGLFNYYYIMTTLHFLMTCSKDFRAGRFFPSGRLMLFNDEVLNYGLIYFNLLHVALLN